MGQMSTTVAIPAQFPEPSGLPAVRTPAGDDKAKALDTGPAAEAAELRLVIEEDKSSGSYVYKTVDVRTGTVIQQIPREEVLRLKEASSYQPGAVVNARG